MRALTAILAGLIVAGCNPELKYVQFGDKKIDNKLTYYPGKSHEKQGACTSEETQLGCAPIVKGSDINVVIEARPAIDRSMIEGQVPFALRSTSILIGVASTGNSGNQQGGGSSAGSGSGKDSGKDSGKGGGGTAAGASTPSAAAPTGPNFISVNFGYADNCKTQAAATSPQTASNSSDSAAKLSTTYQETGPNGEVHSLTTTYSPAPTAVDDSTAATTTQTDNQKLLSAVDTCLSQTSTTAAPDEDTGTDLSALIYKRDGFWQKAKFWGTDLNPSISYLDNSYILSSVGVNFQDNRSQILTNAASAAAVGFTFSGPFGAGIAAAGSVGISIVGQNNFSFHYDDSGSRNILSGSNNKPSEADIALLNNLTCVVGNTIARDGPPQKLNLPVALTLNDLVSTIPAEIPNDQTPGPLKAPCWRPLPGPDNSGWFFKFIFTHREDTYGTISPKDYFNSADSDTWKSVPYSSCRRGLLLIGWWKEMINTPLVNDLPPADSHYGRYPITIADPAYLRAMTLPSQGQVTMGTVCGANLQTTAGQGTSASDSGTQLFNLAKAIKTGQTSSGSSGSGGSGSSQGAGSSKSSGGSRTQASS